MLRKEYYVWNAESHTIVDIGNFERMTDVAEYLNELHQTNANQVIKAGK